MNRRRFGVLLAGTAGAIASCRSTEEVVSSTPSVVLRVSAAASLKGVMERVQVAYEQENAAVAIVYNFGSSGALAQQIVQGGRVDAFISAAPGWIDSLSRAGLLLESSRQDLLKNSLVLVVPGDDDTLTSTVFAFESLKDDRFERIAIGEPESAPVGDYAKESLQAMGLYDDLRSKLVLGKDSSQVLTYVAAGEVEAGIVYATDAAKTDGVRLVAKIGADTHSPIVYPVAVIKESEHLGESRAFVDFLLSEVAAEIFLADGFELAK